MICLASGGIGNQLFVLAHSLFLAEQIQENIYIVSDNKELVEEFKKLECSRSKGVKLFYSVVLSKLLHRSLGKLNKFKRKRYCLTRYIGGKILVMNQPWSTYLNSLELSESKPLLMEGYFQSVAYLDKISESGQELLLHLLSTQPKRNIESTFPKIVSVHLRRGDYKSIREYGVLKDEFFLRALREIYPNGKVIKVASDDSSALYDFDCGVPFMAIHPNETSPLQTLRELGQADCFIMSNSTFSFWVGWKVNKEGGKVFAPSPWFKETNVPEEYLYMKNFIKYPALFS